MMELSNGHGLSSPRSPRNHDAFPAGLRVLVVDDDLTWLKILEKMLKKCNYEVTICGLARDALKLLRERKDAFDIVLSDVNMPDMDGFKLLELVGLEMDLPVISRFFVTACKSLFFDTTINLSTKSYFLSDKFVFNFWAVMSVDGETSRVKKGVQHGACDYLLKPIRMKELRNIWQHVFRKRIHEVRDIEYLEGLEGVQMARSGYDRFDNGHFYNGEDTPSTKKRRDLETKHEDKDYADPSCSSKKARVVWSVELHQKFVKAVNQIGYDKVGPKKILDLMNVSWLTRENVASHLQKYRLYLSRLQKENDLKTSFGGMKPSDPTPQDAAGNSGHQINLHQNDVANGNFRFSSNNLLIQNLKSKSNESDTKGMMVADQSNHPGSSTSQTDFTSLFRPQESEAKYVAYEPITPRQYYWREVPEIQFQQANDPKLGKDSFGHVPMPGLQNRIQVDQPERASSISQKARLTEIELPGPIETKPLYADYTVNNFTQASPVKSGLSSFSVPGKGHALNPQVHESVSINTLSTISQGFDSSCITDLESSQKDLSSATESPFVSPDEVLQLGWLQDSYYPTSLGTQNLELSDFVDPSIITGVPMHLYDALKFDYDQVSDQSDLSIINQGLFIA